MTTEPATVAAPTAQVTAWTETVVITITDAPPFDLPTLGYFSGYGELPAHGEVLKPGDLTPYAFTVGRVEIEIADGAITDQGAFPAGGSAAWRPVRDQSEEYRRVDSRGVHRKHWPAWLAELVDRTLGKHDARAGLPEECTNCGSRLLSWTVAPSRTGTGVGDGRLRLVDVTSVFALGCDECSETVATLSADEVTAAMNTAHRPRRER
jgi:hypothetical protein